MLSLALISLKRATILANSPNHSPFFRHVEPSFARKNLRTRCLELSCSNLTYTSIPTIPLMGIKGFVRGIGVSRARGWDHAREPGDHGDRSSGCLLAVPVPFEAHAAPTKNTDRSRAFDCVRPSPLPPLRGLVPAVADEGFSRGLDSRHRVSCEHLWPSDLAQAC